MSKKDLPKLPYLDGPLSHPFYSRVVKRGIDLVLALLLLIPGLILMAPLALWIRLDSPGPVLYKAVRGGYHNQPFYIYSIHSTFPAWRKFIKRIAGCLARNHPSGLTTCRATSFQQRPRLLRRFGSTPRSSNAATVFGQAKPPAAFRSSR